MSKILLINPSWKWKPVYKNVLYSIATAFFPSLSLAMVASQVKKNGNEVKILDLSFRDFDINFVLFHVKKMSPDIIGFTAVTPLFPQVAKLSKSIKKISPNILTIGGGPHCSALPEQSIVEANLDVVCVGEGEFALAQIAQGIPLKYISGLVYKEKDGTIKINPPRKWIEDLDDLSMPAWDAFNLKEYFSLTSRLMVRKPLGGYFETTRGCLYRCNFCANIPTQGNGLRKKSIGRVIEEIKYMKSFGFNELSITDNLFTTDVNRAKEICRKIIDKKLDIAWQCHSGIRVDAGDQEMFDLMHRAGCYRVAFGFESGNDEILKRMGKGGNASVSRAIEAVKMAHKAGIEVLGYFMIGLLNDTKETMRETIEFGRKLKVDLLKVSYCIPFPGTAMFNELHKKNLITNYNWEYYNVYHPQDFFIHPTLNKKIVKKYYKLAYRRMIYTNPNFIFRRLISAIRRNELFFEIYYFIKFMLSGAKI